MKSNVRHLVLVNLLGLALGGMRAAPEPAPPPAVPDSLDLKTTIGYALDNNFAIRQARERIKQQEGVEIQVSARRIPNVSASGSYTGNDKEISTYTPATNNTWSIALQARQVLYAGGGVQSSIRSARLVREAAVFELEGVINQCAGGERQPAQPAIEGCPEPV
jgi:outer membrane protein TolC